MTTGAFQTGFEELDNPNRAFAAEVQALKAEAEALCAENERLHQQLNQLAEQRCLYELRAFMRQWLDDEPHNNDGASESPSPLR